MTFITIYAYILEVEQKNREMKKTKTIVPIYKKGYMTLGNRPSRSEYDPSTDAAIRVFDTIHLPVVTIEIGGRIFTEIDPTWNRYDPDTLLDQVTRKLSANGFQANSNKLFTGKFAQYDPIKGLEIEWEPASHYLQELAEKLAADEIEKDAGRTRNSDRVSYWFWHESWKGYEQCLVPKTVKHVKSLEVKTSPEILNDWFITQLEPFVT